MEETKDLVLFIVIASSSVVLLLIVVLLDLFLIFRKRKVIARQEIKIRDNKIDELIMKNEVEAVNATLKGQSSERQRISRELHDRLGGILFAAKLFNATIERKPKADQTGGENGPEKLASILDEAMGEVRRLSHDLYHNSSVKFKYSDAVRQLADAIEASSNVKIAYKEVGDLDEIDEAVQQELYAITREMLSNTLKHAEANEVQIEIRGYDTIEFRFGDDGKGFDSKKKYDGIGLFNLRQRTEKIGGNFTLESSPGSGTLYRLSIPVAQKV